MLAGPRFEPAEAPAMVEPRPSSRSPVSSPVEVPCSARAPAASWTRVLVPVAPLVDCASAEPSWVFRTVSVRNEQCPRWGPAGMTIISASLPRRQDRHDEHQYQTGQSGTAEH